MLFAAGQRAVEDQLGRDERRRHRGERGAPGARRPPARAGSPRSPTTVGRRPGSGACRNQNRSTPSWTARTRRATRVYSGHRLRAEPVVLADRDRQHLLGAAERGEHVLQPGVPRGRGDRPPGRSRRRDHATARHQQREVAGRDAQEPFHREHPVATGARLRRRSWRRSARRSAWRRCWPAGRSRRRADAAPHAAGALARRSPPAPHRRTRRPRCGAGAGPQAPGPGAPPAGTARSRTPSDGRATGRRSGSSASCIGRPQTGQRRRSQPARGAGTTLAGTVAISGTAADCVDAVTGTQDS